MENKTVSLKKEAKKYFWDCERAETRATPFFMAASEILSILIFFSGCAVLLGWALDIPVLKSVLPGLVTMKANTALCFAFSGFSLWFLQIKRRDQPFFRSLGLIFGFAVFVTGLLTLLEYLLGRDFGIDQFLFKELPGAILTSSPGRMAFNTAFNFTITGLALLLLASKTKDRCFVVQVLMIPTGGISILAFIGYLYHANPLFLGAHFSTAMALHTVVLFLFVFSGILFCRPGCGIMALVSSDALGGKMVRRLFPITVSVPLVLGWIKLQGQISGTMSNEFGVALVATGNLVVTTSYVFFLSFWLNKADAERKRVEEARRDTEIRYRLLFEQSPDGIVIIDPASAQILEFNETAHRQLEYTREEFSRLRISDIEVVETSEETAARIARVMREGRSDFETRHRTRQGGIRNIYVTAQFTEMLGRPVYHCVWRDVTALKKAEEDLSFSKKKLDLALKAARMGVWQFDLVENKRTFDNKACSLLGINPVTFDGAGEDFFAAVHPDDREKIKETLARTIDKGVLYEPEYRVVWLDGSVHHIAARGELVRDDQRNPKVINGIIWDITGRKKAEDEIRKLNEELEERVERRTAELAAAFKEQEAFSYSVAHDLKSPLRAMAGFANILSEDYAPKLDDNGKRVIGVINDNAKNMGQMIDDLLKLSQTGRITMNFIDIDVTALVRSVYHELKEGLFRDRDIDMSVKPLPAARADSLLVRQIFTNLILNAMKFTARKEKAVIEIGGCDKDREHVYYVKDNGAGFDMKYKDRLFGTFQRIHTQDEFGGTGIGLAIVKSAVLRHGGRVWGEAEVDQGATFYFTLPKGG